MDKLHIAIVDDHELVRNGIKMILADWPHGKVVLEAADGLEYEELCASQPPPDITLVDLQMPRRDGWATLEWMEQNQPATKPIAFSHDPGEDGVHRALRLKACAVLHKNARIAKWHLALDHVRLTGFHKNELTERALLHLPDPGSPEALRRKAEAALSPALLKFAIAYTGDDEPSIVETGERQGVTKNTAEKYRQEIVDRTGARSRLGFYKFLQRFHLLPTPRGTQK